MDKLKLNIRANDMVSDRESIEDLCQCGKSVQLQTDVRELVDVINRMNLIPSNYIGREKLAQW